MNTILSLPHKAGSSLSTAFLLALCISFSASAFAFDRIVAIVGEEIILSSELENAEIEILRQMRLQGGADTNPAAIRKQVLERLVLTSLQTQRARQRGIQATDDDINDAMEMIASRNNLSLNDFRVALNNEGINYNFYREQLRDEILINRLRQKEVDSRVTVTDRDVDLFLQAQAKDSGLQYKLRQILVAIDPDSDSEARAASAEKANQLLERLQAGEDFVELAQSQSDGQQALEGGDLGWIDGHLLPTVFADRVPELKKGEITDVLKSDSGLHIVKLEDTRTAGKRFIAREVKSRHILLQSNEIRDDAATATLAQELYAKLQKDGDFSELAKEYSSDPGSASEGGNLGWQDPKSFDPSFASVIESLDINQISEPFQSSFGWHIAEVLEWRERDLTDLQRRSAARNILRQRRTSEEYDRWLRRLRGDAYVEFRLPEQNSPAGDG